MGFLMVAIVQKLVTIPTSEEQLLHWGCAAKLPFMRERQGHRLRKSRGSGASALQLKGFDSHTRTRQAQGLGVQGFRGALSGAS